jgi:SAM-dependent methyltransferase
VRADSCPVCGGARTAPNPNPATPGLLRCPDCGLVFRERPVALSAQPSPAAADLERLNAGRHDLFAVGLRLLAPHRRLGRLLDVGAGPGGFVKLAAEAGWRPIGIEPDAAVLRLAAALGVPGRVRAVAGALPCAAASLDAVTFWDTLDIVADPVGALREALSVLRPGGIVLARVRNGPVHLLMRRLPLVPASASVVQTTLFSRRTLGRSLEAAGFCAVRVRMSPLTARDPYRVETDPAFGLHMGRRTWSVVAAAAAAASGHRLQIGPSLLAIARRPEQDPESAR